MGRHSQQEVYDLGIKDLEALSVLLGDKKYFFGDEPVTLDCSAFGVLGNLYLTPVETEFKQAAMQFSNLKDYAERVKKEWFATALRASQ
jgi:glutathione S-transferase